MLRSERRNMLEELPTLQQGIGHLHRSAVAVQVMDLVFPMTRWQVQFWISTSQSKPPLKSPVATSNTFDVF